MPPRSETLQHLLRSLQRREGARRPPAGRAEPVRSTGIPGLDALLPDHGLHPGSLSEWIAADTAGGAGTLVFRIAAQLRCESEVCLIIDREATLYPPALCRWGVDLAATIVVRPASLQESLWAWEQSLRCRGVGVVIGWLEQLQNLEFRRLQLAAETGGGIGLLLRSARHRQQPSWADHRFCVTPQPMDQPYRLFGVQERSPPRSRRVLVDLVQSRGHFRSAAVLLDIDDETGAVRPVPRLAPAARPRRAAGA